MDKTFNEDSEDAEEIMGEIEEALNNVEHYWLVHFKKPKHDIARQFLNEIVEFEPGRD